MRVDELQRELARRIETAPGAGRDLDAVVRRGRRRLARRRFIGGVAAVLLLAAVATPIVLRERSTNTVSAGPVPGTAHLGWAVHDKTRAGLGTGTLLHAVANSGDSLLAAGARPTGPARSWRPAIWYSNDGTNWKSAPVPLSPGEVVAIAAEGNRAIAVGTDGSGLSTFVWASEDRGRHWAAIAEGTQIFGSPAPQMGRPFVTGLRAVGRTWVANGGSSDGYAAVWTSRDGTRWRQVLDSAASRTAGSVDVTTAANGRLFGYWATTGWYSARGRSWGAPIALVVPDRLLLRTVAPRASVAFGESVDRGGLPTPLLRSDDDGRTWTVDRAFLDAAPGATVLTVTRTGGLWVAAGTSGSPNHPDAWVSTDLTRWHRLPESLYGGPGGTLGLVGVAGKRLVILGTAPELDRFYTLDAR
ncbi:MAG TPA: hypothetical protein VEP49_01850 [Acidimicrobiia bacterium]|nr:hypothetical protein [Acidimicrobiia bacterium]